MLNSGKKNCALRDKKKYSHSCIVRKKNSERNKKPYPPPPPRLPPPPPPFKLNGRSLNISCLLFSHRFFGIISCIYIMAIEVKYKKSGENSCAVNGCNLNEWKQTFCELHKQKHEDSYCVIPYRLHTMPSKESIRLRWANALNRKSLPKQVFVCSEHYLDGKPTERNPIP